MLEGIRILIDRMEMFPDDFREGGNLHDFLFILDDDLARSGGAYYYEKILTKEEIAAYREATIKFHRENLNRAVIESVIEGLDKYNPHKFADMLSRSAKNTAQTMQNNIGGGAFTTKTGALFTPANTPKKKK
jgi:hypothetical protein